MLKIVLIIIIVILVIWIVYLLDMVDYLKVIVDEKEYIIQRYEIKLSDICELDIPCKNREIQKLKETIEELQTKLQKEIDTHKIEMTVRIKPSQVYEVKKYIENLK